MKNKLFITCPFSQMESYLQDKFGRDIYFITFPGSLAEWRQNQFSVALREFIERHLIREIYLVTDTGCAFIDRVITGAKFSGLFSEKIMRSIYEKNFATDFENTELPTRQFKLAELTIRTQTQELMRWNVLGAQIVESKIELKGLVTTKRKNLLTEIKINN